MIMVLDNAPYHHCCDLKPLATMNKPELVTYLKEHGCTSLGITPEDCTEERRDDVTYNIEIDTPAFLKKASKSSRHTTCSVLELRKAALRYFQTVHPLMVKSKVASKFEEKGWSVLFMPPYCPDVQPIELFWAAGKNWARYLNPAHTRTIEQCIKDLRAGWYGDEIKDAADCRELIRHSIDGGVGLTKKFSNKGSHAIRAVLTRHPPCSVV